MDDGINFLAWLNVSLTGSVLLIHVFCLLILWRYDKPKKQCFIITLLMSELFVSILQLSKFVTDHTSSRDTVAADYIISISAYTLNIPYCGGLVLLTLERFMEIHLHIKYYASFFYLNRLKFCTGLWIVDVGITGYSLASILTKGKSQPSLLHVYQINLYFLHVAHGFILILFSSVYIYIYKLFHRSVKQQQKQQRRSKTMLKTSKIFAPFLIVLTFICFMTIPMMLYIHVFPESDKSWVLLFNRVNSITDGLLYVLFNPRIRKKLRKRKYTNTSQQTTTVHDSVHVVSHKTSSSQQMDSTV